MINKVIGTGLYNVSDVASLAAVSSRDVRHWAFGYRYKRDKQQHFVNAVWRRDFADIDEDVLSFADLLEVRFIKIFREKGVSLYAVRQAARLASEHFNSNHAFSIQRFRTDGVRIFSEIEELGSSRLYDLNRNNYTIRSIVEDSLYKGIEFGDVFAKRWYPMWPSRSVVIDPERNFGKPTIAAAGIPTAALAQGFLVEKSVSRVAAWFEISPKLVRAALKYEKIEEESLRAA